MESRGEWIRKLPSTRVDEVDYGIWGRNFSCDPVKIVIHNLAEFERF